MSQVGCGGGRAGREGAGEWNLGQVRNPGCRGGERVVSERAARGRQARHSGAGQECVSHPAAHQSPARLSGDGWQRERQRAMVDGQWRQPAKEGGTRCGREGASSGRAYGI